MVSGPTPGDGERTKLISACHGPRMRATGYPP